MNDLYTGALLGFAAGVVVGVLGTCGLMYHFKRKRIQPPAPSQSPATSSSGAGTPLLDSLLEIKDMAEDLRQNLRVKFLYDEAKVDQAIELERERNPKSTIEELMQAAIYRWERENR